MTYEEALMKIKHSPLSKFKIGRGAEEDLALPSPTGLPCVTSNCDDPANPDYINPAIADKEIDKELK